MARICDSLGDLAFPVLASTADVSLTFVFVPFASFLLPRHFVHQLLPASLFARGRHTDSAI